MMGMGVLYVKQRGLKNMTDGKTKFVIDHDKIRARLAEEMGETMATQHEVKMIGEWGNKRIIGNSGWTFDDEMILRLIEEGLIQKPSDLDDVYLDEIETIEEIDTE